MYDYVLMAIVGYTLIDSVVMAMFLGGMSLIDCR